MKIDVVRKLPETMDTIVIFHSAVDTLSEVEYVPSDLLSTAICHAQAEDFNFKYNTSTFFTFCKENTRSKVILCGSGNPEELNAEKLRACIANIIRTAQKIKSKTLYLFIGIELNVNDVVLGHVLAEISLLCTYKFSKYLTDSKPAPLEALHIVLDSKNTRHINRGIVEGRIYAETTILARNLVNEPANVLTPEALAEAAKKTALDYGFSIEIHSADKLRRIKMDSFLAVGRGSKHEPKLIIMRYFGNPEAKHDIVGLVGKGLTYDSGGYCIKPPLGMVNMKNDMGGAAAVIGAFAAISTLKLKVNVVGIIAACENMISGDAYRPGDIIRSMAGKYIEVINTDAEGRLTLIDAVHYAIDREHATRVLDIATLTGAAAMALGPAYAMALSNDDDWMHQLNLAAENSGEKIWRFPLHEEYAEHLKSDIADLKNMGSYAGAISAGLFIREFIDGKPWIHLDIAGCALREKESGIYSVGGTGYGVRLLTCLLKQMEKE